MGNYVNNAAIKDDLDHNTKWCDLPVEQVFQFDHEPVSVIQAGTNKNGGVGAYSTTNGSYNDLYQMTKRLQNKEVEGWQSWMNWVEKIQPDYKFLTVLQKNAQTCIFANVDDPWMFTQYIFKGIGKYYNPLLDDGQCAVESSFAIIQPALYQWDTLEPINAQATQRMLFQSGKKYQGDLSQYFHVVSDDGWYKKQFGDKDIRRYTTGADGAYMYKVDVLVQCVKWGQHGNIPPHVLDMQAPSKYMQSATKLTLKTCKKPVLGVPLYNDSGGYFRKVGDHLYLDNITFSLMDKQVNDSNGNKIKLPTFRGSITTVQKQLWKPTTGTVNTQTNEKVGGSKLRLVSTERDNKQLLFNGCKYFKVISQIDNSWVKCGCSLDSDFTVQQRNQIDCDASACTSVNSKCPFYTKAFNINSPKVIVARFQAYERRYYDNNFELKRQQTHLKNLGTMLMGTGTLGGVLAASTAFAAAGTIRDKSKDGDSGQLTYQISYQMQQTPLNGIVVNVPPNAENYKGATVQRGTGQSAFDLPAIAQRTIYQNDTSPINYTRWTSNIMPCYDRKYCNITIGLNNAQKVQFPCNCGVDYKAYGEHNQIITKNSGFCPYYKQANRKNMGCPYNSINKTAMDFAFHNKLMNQNLYIQLALPIAARFASGDGIQGGGDSAYRTYTTQTIYAQQDDNKHITIYYKDINSKTNKRNFPNDDVAVIQLSRMYGIQQQVLLKYHTNNLWQLCKVKYVEKNGVIASVNNMTQCWAYAKYWPYTMGDYTNGGNNATRLTNANGESVQWVFEIQFGSIPKKDPIFVDNQMKFVGGYHPQYLQYPASPQQVLYKKEQPYDEYDVIETKADASEFGQVARVGSKQVQYGYFIMQTGNWVQDGRSIGQLQGDAEMGAEKNSRAESPNKSFKGGIAIHNRWTNTLIDPQAQKPITKQIQNCIIYSNDTAGSISILQKEPPQITPQDSDEPVDVPPQIRYPQYLPRERQGCYCENCKTVLAIRFYQFGKQVTKCPWCGAKFVKQKPMLYFPRTKAMGRVSIWGLAGTIIKTDNYFWKSQVKVNNTLIEQMSFKLGVKNSSGGGYQSTNDGKKSQLIDRVPYYSDSGKYSMGMTQGIYKYISSVSSVNSSTLNNIQSWNNLVMTNPNMPKLNLFGESKGVDCRVVNPFTKDFNGLQMVTADYMVSIRNRLQPTLAYMVGKKPGQRTFITGIPLDSFNAPQDNGQNPGDPEEYQQYRVNYDDRKQLSFYKKWVKRRNVVNNVVVAYAGNGDKQAQAFVQFPVGTDEEWYWAKKYYPPDPHWWYDRQLIGGIATDLKGNECHIDLPQKMYPGYRWDAYKNIQEKLQSSTFICMHGYVPLDKMVAAAYLIQPGVQMSCDEDPVGQFQLFGSNLTRVAYNHYHSFYCSDKHQANTPLHNGTGQTKNQHVHGDSGNFKEGDKYAIILDRFKDYGDVCSNSDRFFIDKYGDIFFIDQVTGIPIYSRRYFQSKKNKFLSKTQDVHLNPWHQQNLPYISMLKKVNMDAVLSSLAHSVDSHIGDENVGYGLLETDCIKWGGFGEDIIQVKAQNAIWKEYTTQQFQQYQQQYRADIQYTVDFGDGNVQTKQFIQYYSKFNNFIAEQMQPIPGYFPSDGFNSSGLTNKNQNKLQVDTEDIQGEYGDFIVVQSSGGGGGGSNALYVQAGESDKSMDITNNFKQLYYKRVQPSYTAQTSSCTLQDFYTIADSKWQGVGNEQNSDQRVRYNTRQNAYGQSSNGNYSANGYILNTNDWMPKIDQERKLNAVQYEKIEFDRHVLYYTKTCCRTYQFKSGEELIVTKTINGKSNTKKVSIGEKAKQGQPVQNITLQVDAIVQKLHQADVTQAYALNNNIIIQTDGKTQYDIKCSGIEFLKTPMMSNRIVAYTDYYGEFHPYNLINFYLSKDGQDINRNANYGKQPWITVTNKQEVQTCVIDLYHTPQQLSRRDYRVERGYIDYTNSKCTNQNCRMNWNNAGLSIGAAARNEGLNFNKSSDSCPWCGQKLTKGQQIDSDGIKTYIYQALYQQQQIVQKIKFQMLSKDQTGFNIDNRVNAVSLFLSNDLEKWQCIFTAIPVSGDQYKYTVNKIYQDGVTYENKEYNANEQYQFTLSKTTLFRGRYLKISIQPSVTYKQYSFAINSYNNGCIDVADQLKGIPNGILKGCYCIVYGRTTNNQSYELSMVIKDNVGSKVYIKDQILNRIIGEKITLTKIDITAKLFRTCLAKLNVIGCSYLSNKLIITPKATIESRSYSSQVDLGYLPIRFDKVSIIMNDCYQIVLKQIMKYADIDDEEKGLVYLLQVANETFTVQDRDDKGNYKLDENGNITYRSINLKYYKIKSGSFYFDVGRKKIMMPKYFYATQYITQLPFGQVDASQQKIGTDFSKTKSDKYYIIRLDQFTDNLSKWGIYKTYRPTQLNTIIWTGQQGGVNLKITAVGVGPMYQVERGSICFIDTPKYKNGGLGYSNNTPDGNYAATYSDAYNGKSTPLPNTSNVYTNYAEINKNAQQKQIIPWIVYNNQLITKKDGSIQQLQGQFYVTTNATMRTDNSQQFFYKNIMGQHCQRAVGRCQGQITLKGKPNTIISGELIVYAAPVTKRQFNGDVVGYQLTGGLDKGGFMVTPKIKKDSGRAALGYQLPYVLVYLKQFSPFDFGGTQPQFIKENSVQTIEYSH